MSSDMMAAMAQLTVYNAPSVPPNWDRVGCFYVSFCATWTFLLLIGMGICLYYQRIPILRVRGLPLSFTAITLLHIYWILGQITYPVGRTMNMVLAYDIQFFFMGIYYPLGIALFHASNLRFLHVAKRQRQFAHPRSRIESSNKDGGVAWLSWWRNMRYMTKVLIVIGIGMVVQVGLTIGMWAARTKYHPTWGAPGTGIKGSTLPEQVADLGRGWEWWPTLVWQFTWAWIVAPILLIRAWSIRDTMGWRTQTIACCVCSLHSVPMFLIASYVPAFAKVNQYFTTSQWIHISITMYEIFTVFVPIFDLVQLQILSRKARQLNGSTDSSWLALSLNSALQTKSSMEWKDMSSSTLALSDMEEFSGDRLLTMDALEHVLVRNPESLQRFAAFSDFSGENIAFLSRFAEWKAAYAENPDEEQLVGAYNHALWLYTNFISPRDAEFPLNLSSQSINQQKAIFEKAARILHGEGRSDSATPFDEDSAAPPTRDGGAGGHWKAWYTGEIPENFDQNVFNEVQAHVKYLVLTNTWPKFVVSMRPRSNDSLHSDFTRSSRGTTTLKQVVGKADV